MKLRTAETDGRARPAPRSVLPGHLRAAVYSTVLLMVALPVIDVLVQVWPLRPGLMTWRYGAVGTAGGTLFTPVLGVLGLLLASSRFGDRRVSFALAAVTVSLGLALLGAAALFALDALQLRPSTGVEVRPAFTISAMVVFGKIFFGGLVCVAVGAASARG